MSELKAYRNIDVAFNTARQTETVIAEDYEGYCIEFEEDDEVYIKDEVDAAIAKLKADNAELKHKLHDAEMQADLAECAVTEYKIDCDKLKDENRKLKRALYKACANWAICEIDYWRKCLEHVGDYFDVRTGQDLDVKRCEKMIRNWINSKSKCIKNAEKYK